jgi:CHAT domain-containing protein/tetratricopeptide (TPR) repeat protein
MSDKLKRRSKEQRRQFLFRAVLLLAVFLSVVGNEAISIQQAGSIRAFEVVLSPSGSASIQATSKPGSFVLFSIETAKEQLSLKLVSPEGGERRKVNWRDIPTDFSGASKSGGKWTLSIHCEARDIDCGRVRGTVSIRPAADSDQERIRAERLFDEAEALDPGSGIAAEIQAQEKYSVAAGAWAQSGDRSREALANLRIGQSFSRTGATDKALEAFRTAAARSHASGDPILESWALSEAGAMLAVEGKDKEGREACDQALTLAQQVGRSLISARAQYCLGEVEYHRGSVLSSIEFYKKAEALHREANDRRDLAEILLVIGASYCDLSRYEETHAYFDESLRLSQQLADKHGQGLALMAIGRMHERQGHYQEALNAFQQALELIQPLGDLTWIAAVMGGIGSIYNRMGDLDQTVTHWNKSLELFHKAKNTIAEIDALLGIGNVLLATGRIDQAQARIEEAVTLSKNIPNPGLKAVALHYMGQIYWKRGEPARALENYAGAFPLFEEDKDLKSSAALYASQGQAYEDLGKTAEAVESYQRAIELARRAQDPLMEASARYLLARALANKGNRTAALQQIESAIGLAESLRGGVYSSQMRTSYVDSTYRYYGLKIELLMRLEQDKPGTGGSAAFETSEGARARSLLDSLSEASIDIRQGVDAALLENERKLLGQLNSTTDRLMQLADNSKNREKAGEKAGEIEREIENLAAQIDRTQAEIRSKSPHYAALTQPEPLGLDAIQRRLLDPDTLLLEYSLGDERSFVWIVSSESCLAVTLPPRKEIETAAVNLYGLLTARLQQPEEDIGKYMSRVKEARSRYWQEARSLGQLILGPLAGKLARKRLLIVSDGALQYIPFSALPDPEIDGDPVPLIVGHEIVNLPSASALDVLREATKHRIPAGGTVAVLADPVFESEDSRVGGRDSASGKKPKTRSAEVLVSGMESEMAMKSSWARGGKLSLPRLMSTRREADAILSEARGGTTLAALGFDARRELALSGKLTDYRYVHFATHAVVDSDHPELSGIFLSMIDRSAKHTNGFLNLNDIYNMKLPVEMVVLSACNTALGRNLRGEGLVGFVRGFFYAGAKRILASLWKVDDEATMTLMTRFYRKIFQEHNSPASALRQAQIEMWNEKRWSEPFYWAAFILQGEWN